MKKSKSKYLTLAGLVLGTGVLLSACGNSSTASKTYNYVYSSDPSSLNYLAENRATTNDIVTNLVDGLMENDQSIWELCAILGRRLDCFSGWFDLYLQTS